MNSKKARRKKQRKKKTQEKKTKIDFIYADIETLIGEGNYAFWYGCVCRGTDDDYRVFTNFKDFFNAITEQRKGHKTVVVFHNSDFDVSYIQYHCRHELGYTYNPSKKGETKAIYESQATEIYKDNPLNPVYVVDSIKLIPGSLDSWGDFFGLPKGITPKQEYWREPTDDEIEYVKRDVEILKTAFQKMDCEKSVEQGYLTISSRTQGALNEIYSPLKNKKVHKRGLTRKHGASEEQQEKLPIPTAVKKRIQTDTASIVNAEREKTTEDKKALYGLNKNVIGRIEKKCREYWLKQCSDLYDKFNTRQRKVKKLLEKPWDKRTKDEHDYITAFFDLKLPNADTPDLEWIIDKHHLTRIISGMNGQIQPAMRGGMTYVNPKHLNKTLHNGGVLDVNSLYPFILRTYEIPYTYVGSTKDTEPNFSKYFIAVIKRLKATVHDEKHPFLKRSTTFTTDKSYKREIDWEDKQKGKVHINVLTSVDLKWLYECYDVEEIEYGEIFYFEAEDEFTKAIRQHIDYWRTVKENAVKGSPEYLHAKFMLNTLWGRWGMYDKVVSEAGYKIQIGDEDTNYVSAIFTTSYARVYLNKAMNWFGDNLVYTDTDSVHFLYGGKIKDHEDLMEKLADEIDSKEFGKWDLEKEFKKARYIKSKTYAMETWEGEIKTTTAGGTIEGLADVEQFKIGAEFNNTKSKYDDEGRMVIKDYPFTL